MTYDSTEDTLKHIDTVRRYLKEVTYELRDRALMHDASKLREPEKPLFDEYTPKLKEVEYGSKEYAECLAGLKPALDHHYATYRHHPEHFADGISDMNLIDIVEMLCDWKAATERTKNGDLSKSIYQNAERFGYGPEILRLLWRTARDLGWIDD